MKIVRNLRWIAIGLGMSLLLAACGTFNVSVENTDATRVVTEQVEITEAIELDDQTAFQEQLLQAIQSRDQMGLEKLMTENFTSGWWRGEMGDLPRADAL